MHAASGTEEPVQTEKPVETENFAGVYAITPKTSKASAKSIKLSWSSSKDAFIKYYYIMRRGTQNGKGTGQWKTLAKVSTDDKKEGAANFYTDKLKSSKPQQYEYKICTLSKNEKVDTREQAYEDRTNKYAVLGTNIKICIDPGHYGLRNNNYDVKGKGGQYPYSEGKFTLKIGKALQTDLKQTYGIDSYMTRAGSKISLKYKGKTYTNIKLDQGNIFLRGYMAKKKGCDVFISLHTNMSGRATKQWHQPKSLNKVYVFVNSTAHKSSRGMKIANAIGSELTAYNQKAGIQNTKFITRSKKSAADYSNLKKDISKGNGTVVYRRGSSGGDYYGVLKGAGEMGIEGMIVEHAFHDTRIMRKRANDSSALYKDWAECDAYGIAKGFGFVNSSFVSMGSMENVEKLMKKMSWKEKVAQMILVTAPADAVSVQKSRQFGGFVLFAGDFEKATPASVKTRIKKIQKASKIPMLIAVDEEGGTVVRASKYRQFRSKPYASPRSVYAAGKWDGIVKDTKSKAKFLKNLGINTNLAPVADVAYKSSDFIYKRSFSTGAKSTSTFIKKVVKTMGEKNLVSTLKHFPGYGNNGDTHTLLIHDRRSKKTFKNRDLKPFQAGIDAGCDMIMVSHNIVHCFDAKNPASISPKVISYLRKDMGFDGVVVTDSITMAGVLKYTGSIGKSAVRAVKAGNDLLCTSEYKKTYSALVKAVKNNEISKKRIEESVKRILLMKYKRGIIS